MLEGFWSEFSALKKITLIVKILLHGAKEDEKVEQCFAPYAFNHGRNVCSDDIRVIPECNENRCLETNSIFDSLRISTCANRCSIISIEKYVFYFRTFTLTQTLSLVINRTIVGIGGKAKAIGVALIQVPFKHLGAVLKITFLVLEDKPTLFPTKEMLDIRLDISIQKWFVSLGERSTCSP